MKSNPIQHVVNPYVVGGAIIGLKCQDAIVIGADTLLSYGSLLSIYFPHHRISRCLSFRKNHRACRRSCNWIIC
jgi:hypothetical protein